MQRMKQNGLLKKTLAFWLSLAMILTLFTLPAMAEEDPAEPAQYTVSYENKVAEEEVAFNVMTVDFSGEAPAPMPIENGSKLAEGSYVGVQVINPLDKALVLTQYDAAGQEVDSAVIDAAGEEEGFGGIIIDALAADVHFVLDYVPETAKYTVTYENKVTEDVVFNVMTVDFSGDAPAPMPIQSGDQLEEGAYVGVQVLNPLDRKLILTQLDADGKVVDSVVVDAATEEEEGANGIMIPALAADAKFVLNYGYTVKVTNGAASANTDEYCNGLHVYSKADPDLADINGEAVLEAGTPMKIFAYPLASNIHLTIVHNGETLADRSIARMVAFDDDDKVEFFEFELAGDLEVTTASDFTVNIDNQANSDAVLFNVATVDFSGEVPQQVPLSDGDTVCAGEMVASNVINDGQEMLKLQAVKADGTLIEEAFAAPGAANGIYVMDLGSDVKFILTKEAAPLDAVATAELAGTSYTYNGKIRKPAATVTAAFGMDEVTLVKGTDYTVSYANNQNVGTATVTITGIGNYTGTIKKTFKIAAASIAKATVTVKTQTYTGKELKPAPTVKLGTVTLKKGTDYTVAYTANKNAGKATVTITGKDNYKGTVKGTFTIKKAANPMTVKAAAKTVSYAKVKADKQVVAAITVSNAKGKVTYAKASGSAKLSVNKTTGKITVAKGTAKGTYTMKVKVTAAGNTNYNKLTKTVTIKVTVK